MKETSVLLMSYTLIAMSKRIPTSQHFLTHMHNSHFDTKKQDKKTLLPVIK